MYFYKGHKKNNTDYKRNQATQIATGKNKYNFKWKDEHKYSCIQLISTCFSGWKPYISKEYNHKYSRNDSRNIFEHIRLFADLSLIYTKYCHLRRTWSGQKDRIPLIENSAQPFLLDILFCKDFSLSTFIEQYIGIYFEYLGKLQEILGGRFALTGFP